VELAMISKQIRVAEIISSKASAIVARLIEAFGLRPAELIMAQN